MRFLSTILTPLPWPAIVWLAKGLGSFWFRCLRIRRGVADQNMQRAFPTWDTATRKRILRQCFQHQVMYGLELLRLPGLTRPWVQSHVQREGFEKLDALQAQGRGCIIIMAHLGPLDLCGMAEAMLGRSITVVIKTIQSKSARAFVDGIRAQSGLKLLPPKGSAKHIEAALQKGEAVALVCDQHTAPHRSVLAPFFGSPAATTLAPFRFARQTGAPMFFAKTQRIGFSGRYKVSIEPCDIKLVPQDASPDAIHSNNQEAAAAMNAHFETWIQQNPEQWLWLHRRWKAEQRLEQWQ